MIENEQEISRLRTLLSASTQASTVTQQRPDHPIIDPTIQIDDDRVLIAALRRELHRCQVSSDKKDETIASLQLQRLAIRKELAELRLNGKGISRESVIRGITITTSMNNDDDDDDDDEDLEGDENDDSNEFYLTPVKQQHHHREDVIERDDKTLTAGMIPVSSVASIPRTTAPSSSSSAAAAATVVSAGGTTMIHKHDITTTSSMSTTSINEMEEVEFLDGFSSSIYGSGNGSGSGSGTHSSTSTTFRTCSSSNMLQSLPSTTDGTANNVGVSMIGQTISPIDSSPYLLPISSHEFEYSSSNVSPSKHKQHQQHLHRHGHRHRPGIITASSLVLILIIHSYY